MKFIISSFEMYWQIEQCTEEDLDSHVNLLTVSDGLQKSQNKSDICRHNKFTKILISFRCFVGNE